MRDEFYENTLDIEADVVNDSADVDIEKALANDNEDYVQGFCDGYNLRSRMFSAMFEIYFGGES